MYVSHYITEELGTRKGITQSTA